MRISDYTPPAHYSRLPGKAWASTDSAVMTAPKGGSPAESSSWEDDSPSPDAAINIWSSSSAPNATLGPTVKWANRIIREQHRTCGMGWVRGPQLLAQQIGCYCNPQSPRALAGSPLLMAGKPEWVVTEKSCTFLLRKQRCARSVGMSHPHMRLQRVGCPYTEDNAQGRHQRTGNLMDGAVSLKRYEPSTICSFRETALLAEALRGIYELTGHSPQCLSRTASSLSSSQRRLTLWRWTSLTHSTPKQKSECVDALVTLCTGSGSACNIDQPNLIAVFS